MRVVCGRPDLGEEYLCELLAKGKHGADPIVRVEALLRYPRQHALYNPDVAVEIPPIAPGRVCRLPFLRAWSGETPPDPGDALREALARESCPAGREIIRRHMEGEYCRQRQAVYFNPRELEKCIKE